METENQMGASSSCEASITPGKAKRGTGGEDIIGVMIKGEMVEVFLHDQRS